MEQKEKESRRQQDDDDSDDEDESDDDEGDEEYREENERTTPGLRGVTEQRPKGRRFEGKTAFLDAESGKRCAAQRMVVYII